MGDDGHTASLFPGTTALHEKSKIVVVNWVEKFNTYRFADHKEKVIDLLQRVTRVSIETMKIVEAMRVAARRAKEDIVVVCFSGRGDKDCFEVASLRGEEI